jgi:hypothetical protein
MILLAMFTTLLAKIKFYWRLGNNGRFFPVRVTLKIKAGHCSFMGQCLFLSKANGLPIFQKRD